MAAPERPSPPRPVALTASKGIHSLRLDRKGLGGARRLGPGRPGFTKDPVEPALPTRDRLESEYREAQGRATSFWTGGWMRSPVAARRGQAVVRRTGTPEELRDGPSSLSDSQ